MALSGLFCFSLVKVASLFAGSLPVIASEAWQSIMFEPMTVCFNVIPLAEQIASSSRWDSSQRRSDVIASIVWQGYI